VAVTVVRDGETWIEAWLAHYLRLGVDEIVLLDNGSADRTVELALAEPRATVLRCTLPFRLYDSPFKRYLIERFGDGRWCLLADIDEFFDYPFSGELPFARLLEYLNRRGYTAVMATMLDLFADGPASSWPVGGRELVERCVWYDLSSLVPSRPWRLHLRNRFADRQMPFYRGGIMYQAFGVRQVATKFPLIFYRTGGRLSLRRHGHFCRGAWVADVSAVIYHYKYDRRFGERCRTFVERGQHFDRAGLYRAAVERLACGDELVLRRQTARRLEHVNQLVDEGLLRVSDAYRGWVRAYRTTDSLETRPQ
jgi:glycosyltransferase involved in cell wall biosynthesis